MVCLSNEYIRVKDIMMDKDLYRALTQLQYCSGDDEISISTLINDMLKEYLHTYVLSKTMGHMLMSKNIVKIAVDSMTDEQMKEASAINAIRYKEGAIIEHGRPSLVSYLKLIKAFAKVNKFDVELSKNPENDNQVLVMSFHMGEKFSKLKGDTYRRLLEEFADIDRMEITGSTVYFEFKPKKEEVVQETK
jgi:hypothetical protein